MHVFTYGTLMFPEVWQRVVNRDFANQSADLRGYEVRRVIDDLYPVLCTADGSTVVSGLVYFQLDADAIARLDEYESDVYDRRPVEVILDDGQPLTCETYILKDRYEKLASNEPWDAAWFERVALRAYLQRFE